MTSPPVPVSTPAISITTDHSAAVTRPPPISTGPSAASSRYSRLRRVGVHQAATFAHQSMSSPCDQRRHTGATPGPQYHGTQCHHPQSPVERPYPMLVVIQPPQILLLMPLQLPLLLLVPVRQPVYLCGQVNAHGAHLPREHHQLVIDLCAGDADHRVLASRHRRRLIAAGPVRRPPARRSARRCPAAVPARPARPGPHAPQPAAPPGADPAPRGSPVGSHRRRRRQAGPGSPPARRAAPTPAPPPAAPTGSHIGPTYPPGSRRRGSPDTSGPPTPPAGYGAPTALSRSPCLPPQSPLPASRSGSWRQ